MNVSTGEIKRFAENEVILQGFTRLEGDEAKQAEQILNDRDSVMLPEDHPLRQQVSNRIAASDRRTSAKSKRKQSRASRKANRK